MRPISSFKYILKQSIYFRESEESENPNFFCIILYFFISFRSAILKYLTIEKANSVHNSLKNVFGKDNVGHFYDGRGEPFFFHLIIF